VFFAKWLKKKNINMFLFLLAATLVGAAVSIQIPTASSYSVIHHDTSRTHRSPSFAQNPYSSFESSSIYGPLFTKSHSSPIYSSFPQYAQLQASGTICPAQPAGPCGKSKYRTLDGTCNNLENPAWGVANSKYARLLTPKYADGISEPAVSVTGDDLPNARLISLIVFGEEDVPDPEFTLANMQWGQIMTHDMSMQAGSTQSKRHGTRCCTDDGKLIAKATAHKTCYPIIVPEEDPAHKQTGTECMNFVRTLTDLDNDCPGYSSHGPAEQITVVTPFMDLSLVYGSSDAQNLPIRAFENGRMVVEERNGGEFPPQSPNVTTDCDAQAPNEICYLGGDARINQNPGLTVLQIILLREHNRIADQLSHINPHWDDETVYQEARRINIAQYQHISYWEWLPIFLGRENMIKNRLLYKVKPGSYVNDYDSSIDPSVLNSHATAAFRYFHSQIEGRLDLISEVRTRTGTLRLSDWFNRPAILESNNNYDDLARGLATQPEQLTDINFDPEIKHFLFRRGRPFGKDLRSIDIQRNRDHGLASYNDFREFCGLRSASNWEDFLDLISPKDVDNLRSLYASHEDVDLTVGASLEAHVDGALAGPTFLCILTEQFFRTRVGDRFFYENGNNEAAFTREQLAQIQKASVARLFCDNGNHIRSIQPKAFWRIKGDNQVVPCEEIKEVDLSYWQDTEAQYPEHSYYSHGFKK
jgi:hypothetical protein